MNGVSKNVNCVLKNEELCIKNEELCIKMTNCADHSSRHAPPFVRWWDTKDDVLCTRRMMDLS